MADETTQASVNQDTEQKIIQDCMDRLNALEGASLFHALGMKTVYADQKTGLKVTVQFGRR